MVGVSDIKEIIEKSTSYRGGKPIESHKIIYDAPTSQLEPVYFWLLDFMQQGGGIKLKDIKKIVDNFQSSPGSGHFGEMGMRTTKMQEEGMKVLGTINQVVKSVLNLIYDLKEFEIRLDHYDKAKEKEPKNKEAGLLALKQIWLDQVDMKRGRGSIHQMTYELGYTTLRDAFMIANSKEDVEKMASSEGLINDQVKRILIPRVDEFKKWVEMSEKELRKRYEIEKSYLKTQVESLKLYASWAKPYLKAAEELKMKGFSGDPSLVNAFNTTLFELTLFGKAESKIESDQQAKDSEMPPEFRKYIDAGKTRKFYSVIVISLTFRGLPQRITQRGDYGFGGRVDINFDCYALNEDEIKLFNKALEKDAIDTSFSILKDAVDSPLEQLKEDLNHFLKDGKKEKKKEEIKEDEINPFTALFGFFKSKKAEKIDKKEGSQIDELKDIKQDNYIEEFLRVAAARDAIKKLYLIYDVYKKVHGQASSPEPLDPNLKPGEISSIGKLKGPSTANFIGSIKKSWNY